MAELTMAAESSGSGLAKLTSMSSLFFTGVTPNCSLNRPSMLFCSTCSRASSLSRSISSPFSSARMNPFRVSIRPLAWASPGLASSAGLNTLWLASSSRSITRLASCSLCSIFTWVCWNSMVLSALDSTLSKLVRLPAWADTLIEPVALNCGVMLKVTSTAVKKQTSRQVITVHLRRRSTSSRSRRSISSS